MWHAPELTRLARVRRARAEGYALRAFLWRHGGRAGQDDERDGGGVGVVVSLSGR